jgi:hypothetical protein
VEVEFVQLYIMLEFWTNQPAHVAPACEGQVQWESQEWCERDWQWEFIPPLAHLGSVQLHQTSSGLK